MTFVTFNQLKVESDHLKFRRYGFPRKDLSYMNKQIVQSLQQSSWWIGLIAALISILTFVGGIVG